MTAARSLISSYDDGVHRRKDDHLRIAASDSVLHTRGTGLSRLQLRHRALPGRDLAQVELGTELLGRELAAPIIVSAMTGGTAEAGAINARLARAAAEHGIGLALGSGRALLRDEGLLETYVGPDRPPLLIANVGVPQLLEPDGIDAALRIATLLEADALAVHLNPLQEAIQPEGQTEFGGAVEAIGALCAALDPLPVVVKEVGFGIGADDVRELAAVGVRAIDVAGAGGTNWALVEGERDRQAREVARAFADWGIGTAEAVRDASAAAPDGLEIIASGGIRDGVEAALCLALGARAAGFARHLLVAAQDDRAGEALGVLVRQLRIATWLAGVAEPGELGPRHVQAVAS